MLTLIVPAVLAGMPAAYDLDYSTLPPANTVPYYEYTIIMSWPGEPDVKVPTGIGTKYDTAKAAQDFFKSLNVADGWKAKLNGQRVTIYGYDDVRIQKITVEGNGPKPLVRRVPYLPPAKKK